MFTTNIINKCLTRHSLSFFTFNIFKLSCIKFHYKIYYKIRKAYIANPDYMSNRHKKLKKTSYFILHTFKLKIYTLI